MAHRKVIGGKYELLRKIASGGMAEVYLAKQTGLVGFEKLVVIKRILPHLAENEEFVRMFLDEARTAADLRHSNVVQIYEVGRDEGTYFIAMEFLHGQDLRRILRRQIELGGRVPLQHGMQMIIDAAAGLHYAHQKADLQGRALNIVHRDISPQNIIVTYDGTTKIVDFGIAKAASQSTETRSGVLKGKYSYMSPEQASGEPIDQRTDQFALGIVAYELTTATRLFKYPNEIMTLHAIIECRITPPVHVLRGYPVDLSDILMRALAKNRADRYPDLAAFASELEEFMARESMVHGPQRVSDYMRGLFTEVIEQEAELGHPLLPDEQSGPSNIQRATARATVRKQREALDELQSQDTLATTGGQRHSQASLETQTTDVTQPDGSAESGLSTVIARLRGRLGLSLAAAVMLMILTGGGLWYALRPAPAQATQGRVVVETDPPGATIYVDGVKFESKTPTLIPQLRVGRTYVLKLELFGYDAVQIEVQAQEGKPTAVRKRLLKSTADYGVVKFVSQPPGAKVYLDGRALPEVTPCEQGQLRVGSVHSVVLTLEGRRDATRKIKIGEGVTRVEVQLQDARIQAQALLNVTTQPAGAQIFAGDQALGRSPITDRALPATGSLEIRAQLDGYQEARQRVQLVADKPAFVELRLVPDKKPADPKATASTKPKRPKNPKKPRGKGTLKVVVPGSWAKVYVNGKPIGITPFTPIKLPAGRYKVRLVNKELGKDVTVPVTIEAGRVARVSKRWR